MSNILNGFGYFIGGIGLVALKDSVYRKETKKYTLITWILLIIGLILIFI